MNRKEAAALDLCGGLLTALTLACVLWRLLRP